MSHPDLDAAAQFLSTTARVLDRRRFERLFTGGDAGPVRAAVAAYRNPDGGLGHGLEPDGRAPGSQPAAVELGLRVLHDADAWDTELVAGVLEWLQRSAPAEGGATFVDPSIEGWPHAPWWAPEPGLPASPVSTGQIAGTLHARRVEHPWLERASELLWERIDRLDGPHAYEMRGVLRFLDFTPERERAERVRDRVAAALEPLVTLDPEAPGETHGPLDFAPRPDAFARPLFAAAVVDAHLDHLASAQGDDGGWTVNFPAWSPAAGADWRGAVTVDALHVLQANGKL